MASAGGTFGAALLAACGSGDTGADSSKSHLVASREDTSKAAVPGGTWVNSMGSLQPNAIDPHRNVASGTFGLVAPVYSALLRFGFDNGNRTPSPKTISGDAAKSWEISPDGLRVTFKLRDNHKFDPRPPTSGRPMTAADVKFSWDRMSQLSAWAADVVNSRSSSAPIESLEAPDAQTIVVKLAFPYGAVNELFAFWYLYILPKEAEGQFDPRLETRGSGPFFLTKAREDTGFEYTKNPDWYVKGRPFLDGIKSVVLPEYTSALAQFEAAAIWAYGVFPEDVLRVKQDHPEMVMYKDPLDGVLNSQMVSFSQLDSSPFKDVRLRQAVSMSIDRDLFLDTFHNLAAFEKVGLSIDRLWSTHLSVKAIDYLDPKGNNFGPNAKYFHFDIAEAKKLIAAAGSPAVEYFSRGETSQQWSGYADVFVQMLAAAGFNVSHKALATTDWRNAKESAGEGYKGMFQNTAFGFNDDSFLLSKYSPDGKDRISKRGNPEIVDALKKIRTELDPKMRTAKTQQIQRDLAALMLDVPMEREAIRYSVRWPWLKNHGVFAAAGFSTFGVSGENSTARVQTEYWYDANEHAKHK